MSAGQRHLRNSGATICPATRKLRFASRRDARRLLKNARGRPDVAVTYVYRCPHCAGWHLTSCARRRATSSASTSQPGEAPSSKAQP